MDIHDHDAVGVGIASGSTISFTPSFHLLELHIALLIGPAIVWGFVKGSKEPVSFAVASLMWCVFQLMQGRHLHKMYWERLRERAREKQQARELQAAKTEADDAREEMRHQATHDALTGLLNRAEVLAALEREVERSKREKSVTGVVMLDIDHFKQVNDTYGHLVGDEVLKLVSQKLKMSIRSYDVIGRYGGEEFLIVMPSCTHDEAERSAERLRATVAATPVLSGNVTLSVTVSLGVLAVAHATSSLHELLCLVDAALYAAKRSGRNRVVSASLRGLGGAAAD